MGRALPEPADRAARILSRALIRAARALGLSRRTLAATLGVSEAGVSRLIAGARTIDPGSKEGELAVLVLRLYRSLDALVGGDESRSLAWMHSENHHLGGSPAVMIRTVLGLTHVAEYLDAMRGKS